MAKKKKKKKANPAPSPAAEAPADAPDAAPPATNAGTAPPAGPTGGWAVAGVLALFGFLIYLGGLGNTFALDDLPVVRDNIVLAESDWGAALTSSYWPDFLKTGASNWRPLASASWLLDRVGLEHGAPTPARAASWAFRHHLFNAVWHALCVWLCFPVARRLLGSVPGAWLACAIFAVHPAHTEVVGPVVGRTDLIAGAGALAMCAAFWRWRDGGGGWWLAAAVGAFCVGLGGKESAAPVLLLLPLADLVLQGKPWRWWLGRPALGYLPFAAALVVYLIARTAVLGANTLAHSQAAPLGVWERVAFTGQNSWISAWLLVFPVRFHHFITTVPSDAPFTYPPPSGVWLVVWPAVLLPLWFGWVALVRRAPLGAVLWIAILLPWLPTSGLLPAAAGVSLRFLFISTAFAAVAVVAAGRVWLARRPADRSLALGLAAVWCVAGLVITVRRVPAWKNDGTLHAAVLAEQPGCYTSAYSHGAWIASNGGSLAEARVWFQKAVEIAGDTDRAINARNNLATSYEFGPTGQRYGADAPLERALEVYEKSLRLKPDSGTAMLNAAVVCERLAARTGMPPERQARYRARALELYERSLRLQPAHPDIRIWLRQSAQLCEQLGRRTEAIAYYRRTAAARVASQSLVTELHGPAAGAKEKESAIAELTHALTLQPAPAEAAAIRAELQAWRAR